MTLTQFLLARIAEDETWARDVGGTYYSEPYDNGAPAHHERLIAECEAKRRIVERHVPDRHLENWYWTSRKCAECGGLWHEIVPFAPSSEIGPEKGCPTLRDVAAVYADHDDYRAEWKP